jgi:ABC-type multidrug transport system ATPase subunit
MISGGQRKRVAIGVELVAKPALLWLDEPTSGLDAAVAYDVVGALKSSSERGMNVLAVMHQPRWVQGWAISIIAMDGLGFGVLGSWLGYSKAEHIFSFLEGAGEVQQTNY